MTIDEISEKSKKGEILKAYNQLLKENRQKNKR